MRDDNDTNISKKEVSMMNGFSPFLLFINIYTCYGGGMVFPNSWYMISSFGPCSPGFKS